ncbi:hypothetical protein AMK59_743 [Oryctes borbonicus]|uniref:Uncharacterized protein n=1 Tax=Oryctes borbonicus TaxID=1629725 RepID=A0A0T6BAG7_9SCAR|nr:hypothetical protein AMK59_743 [Oryctes borbonicus]
MILVIPAIGSFCSGGGRCVIVSLKHTTTVAKVVNPLGTVVTVQSDEDVELEPTEEVIHENCDEALFRPVVASKAIIFAESTSVQPKDSRSVTQCNVTTSQKKSVDKEPKFNNLRNEALTRKCNVNKCDSLSEIDSGIEKERSESPLFCDTTVLSPHSKIIHSSQKTDSLSKTQTHSNYPKSKSIICDISDTFADMQFVPLSEPKKQPFNIITPPPLEKLDFSRRSQSPEEHLISLKTPTESSEISYDKDDDQLSKHAKKERRSKCDRYQGLEQKDIVSSSEENVSEDKTIQKKPRKPKTKLGVRITNINKECDEQKDDISVDFHISLPKKSWSSIAASKPTAKDSPQSSPKTSDTEQAAASNISQTPLINEGSFDSDNAQFERSAASGILEPKKLLYENSITDDVQLLKVDKSSDEEKVESSQTETTESDDSSRIPIEQVAMDTEEDTCQLETVKSPTSKISKRKPKKKHSPSKYYTCSHGAL